MACLLPSIALIGVRYLKRPYITDTFSSSHSKKIHSPKKGGGSKFLWKMKQTLQNEQNLFITNITHMMDVISVWNNWCMSPFNGAGRVMIDIISEVIVLKFASYALYK